MNEEYTPFEEWFETFDPDGGELMLYNTIDLEAAYLAGATVGYTKGVTTMREKCAEVMNEMQLYAARDIAAAIRKIEVE